MTTTSTERDDELEVLVSIIGVELDGLGEASACSSQSVVAGLTTTGFAAFVDLEKRAGLRVAVMVDKRRVSRRKDSRSGREAEVNIKKMFVYSYRS